MKFHTNANTRIALILAVLASLLAGCAGFGAPAPTAVPTQDANAVIAAAVSTLAAQMTEEALRNPSPTPQPTNTPEPTATQVPPTPTMDPTMLTPAATATATTPPTPPLAGKFLYYATYPENKREYIPNEKFGLALGFQNVGTIAWDQGAKFKLTNFKGEITVQTEVELGKRVEPGGKVEFNMWAFGSETLGEHVWTFQLYAANGVPIPGAVGYFSYTSK